MERRILVADRADLTRRLIKEGLQKSFEDVIVEEASGINELMEKLICGTYDLVICDSEISPTTGQELLKQMRVGCSSYKTAFIMITPTKDEQRIKEFIQTGASACVVKPFALANLLEEIANHVSAFGRRSNPRCSIEGSVFVHCVPNDVTGHLIDLSLGGILSLFERSARFSILDELCFDIDLGNGVSFDNMNGLIIRIHAADATASSQYVKYAIKFSDLPPAVESELLAYLKKAYPNEW